jgi:NAD(P)-dependent dehydrogenase (short-subunit alcohol dehydrogenase family)
VGQSAEPGNPTAALAAINTRTSSAPGRFASTWDIANAILFLSSAESDFITGRQIVVDCGFSLKAG